MKKEKEFRIAAIKKDQCLPMSGIELKYSDAYKRCIRIMKDVKDVVSCLIYSNKETAIVIKRKHINDGKKS